MVKRLWLVICVLWTLLFGSISLLSTGPLTFGFYFLLFAPWVLGIALFYIWRFIRLGRFTRL